MTSITISPLRDDLPYGARIRGVTHEALKDESNRKAIGQALHDHGMIVFEDVEQSGQMQVEISNCFGPLKDHPVASVQRVDQETMPGVIVITTEGEGGSVVEVDGKKLVCWQPWHFDHCYNNELMYAGLLRTVTLPPEGGMTGYCDGIQIWNDLPEDIKARLDGKDVIYTLDLLYSHMKYPVPGMKVVSENDDILETARNLPRAVHAAVWQRDTGEKVFHMAPWMAFGILGDETPHGDQLFEDVWDAALKVMKPYYHQWKCTEMVAWDNSRMLHRGAGCPADQTRTIHRTTVKGDYGHGRWEDPNLTLGQVEAARKTLEAEAPCD